MRRAYLSSSLFCLSLAFLAAAGCSGETNPPSPPAKPEPPPIVDDQGRVPDLSCPGTAGCEKAEGDLLVGVAKRAITPTFESWDDKNQNGTRDEGESFDDKNGNGVWDGIWMAGFGQGRAAQSIHDDSWSRVLTFEQGDVSVGVVILDLVGLFHQDVVKVRLAAKAKGLDFDHILVATTHDHEARDTMGMWGQTFGTTGYDPSYIDYLVGQTVDALAEARAGQRRARLKVARAEAPELVNDTRFPKVIDQSIHTLQFIDDAGSPFATAVFWGNHPEALGSSNHEFTSDYPHFLRQTIEAHWPETTSLFLNGTLGGLTTTIGIKGCPDANGNETCPQGTFERAEYVGKGAADAAIAAIEGSDAQVIDKPALAVRRKSFFLQPTNGGLVLLVMAGVMPRDVFYADGRMVPPEERASLNVNEVLNGDVVLATEVNGIHLGPVAIAAVPGELYPELWLTKPDGSSYIEKPDGGDFPDAEAETPMQSVLPKDSIKIIVNNANDALGYIIPKTQWDTDPPRAYKNDGQYGEENSVGYTSAPTITSQFAAMYAP